MTPEISVKDELIKYEALTKTDSVNVEKHSIVTLF